MQSTDCCAFSIRVYIIHSSRRISFLLTTAEVFSCNMRISILLVSLLLLHFAATAGKVTGTVRSQAGEPLPYSSITVKGSKEAASANSEGVYFLELPAGTYTIICRHVGFERQEKTISIREGETTLNFVLTEQSVSLSEVVVKAGAEDPAYAIIRKAIRQRKEYLNELKSYECEVYSKGTMSLRDFPKSFMGQKVDFEDGDTSKQKMLYLSETISKLSVDAPANVKVEVISTRVSGQSDGYGFAGARFFSFYDNNVQISNALNPRGFVSPIAENALYFYKYKYEGAFMEDGQLINKIQVIAKRAYEPCFNGYINIVEDEWRIHSFELILTKQSQMNFADTLRIEQLYQKIAVKQWVVQSQVLYPSVKLLGFDAYGSFANVYRDFNTEPNFSKKYFDNTILKYEKGSNKKSIEYWDSIRPLALTVDEQIDYVKKDSLEQLRENPAYLDSLNRISNKIKISHILIGGKTINKQSKKLSYSFPSLFQASSYNTVEGYVLDVPVTIRKEFTDRKNLSLIPHVRYAFSSKQFYAWGTARYNFGSRFFSSISISGGKRAFQLNNEDPVLASANTISTLLFKNNVLKLYLANYARIQFSRGVGNGLTVTANLQYQDRHPLENTTDYTWNKRSTRVYRPNYPIELHTQSFMAHQATILNLGINFQPGAKYIEFPDRTVNIGSKWPTFAAQYTKGIADFLGSDVDYDKWQVSLRDNVNLKLAGRFNYRVQTGGFTNSRRVFIQDMKHFPGNRLLVSTDFLTTFQLAEYYRYSNTADFYTAVFTEHHFNGFLTNKIPLIKKLNWHLVAGASALWLPAQSYAEWHLGLENIFRFFSVDIVTGYAQGQKPRTGIRLGTTFNIFGGGGAD